MRSFPRIGLCLALGTLTSCAGRRGTESPETALRRYVEAIAEHDYEAAYAELSAATRAALPFERFVEGLERDAASTRLRVRTLESTPTDSEASARVAIEGESIGLVYEAGGFRIVGNPADPLDQSTPRGAARAFAFALGERRADWVLRLAPPEARASLDPAVVQAALDDESSAAYADLAEGLAASLDAPIEQHGDLATLPFASGRLLRLVRVAGLWYVDGVD